MERKKLILITGASGFIGSALCKRMLHENWNVRGTVRNASNTSRIPSSVDILSISHIGTDTDWRPALSGVDTVVHLAGRAHIISERSPDPLSEFFAVNTEGTKKLAIDASKAGVRRFIFLSSIGVNGSRTEHASFSEKDTPKPDTPYARSKYHAEITLQEIASRSEMEVVIIRPPLVYGPENPGNFMLLLRLVNTVLPLPFASIQNKRSFIYIGNLVDVLNTCIRAPEAAGQTYCVSDGYDISTPDLIRRIAEALGRKVLLFPAPAGLLSVASLMINRKDAMDKLISSLTIDISKIQRELEWRAPYTMSHGLHDTAKWYLQFTT